jgi:glycosyltransferase involved in cell wall biosynthesis
MDRPRLLCISPSFAPETTPTAIRAGKLIERLSERWQVTVLTEHGAPRSGEAVEVVPVAARRPRRLLATLRRMRLSRLIELAVWPDESVFWVPAAIRAGRRALREQQYDAVVAFMMPYSAGLAALAISRLGRVPLVLNLDDSPTCSDMQPSYPSWLHQRLAVWLEDLYVRRADVTVYVSAENLRRVAARIDPPLREKLRLVRYGAEPGEFLPCAQPEERFEILYVGAMSGWWALIRDDEGDGGVGKRAYRALDGLGRHRVLELDERTSSPAIVARAVQALLAAHEEWRGRVGVSIWGNPYPEQVVDRALAAAGVQDVVSVHGPVPHEQVPALMCAADVLFLTLPRRGDGSAGGRISAKTYEYLMTDRPILAAVGAGENRSFLEDRAGVWVVDPADEQAMAAVLEPLIAAKAGGRPLSVDRAREREELSYDACARAFAAAIDAAIGDGGD